MFPIMVSILGCAIAQYFGIQVRSASFLGVLELLYDQDRATFAGHIPVSLSVEGTIRQRGILFSAQQPVLKLAHERVGAERGFSAAAHHDVYPAANVPPRVRKRFQATCTFREDHAAWTFHSPLDSNLSGSGRIKPCD